MQKIEREGSNPWNNCGRKVCVCVRMRKSNARNTQVVKCHGYKN